MIIYLFYVCGGDWQGDIPRDSVAAPSTPAAATTAAISKSVLVRRPRLLASTGTL